MYELRYDPTIEAVWDSLPDQARDEFDQAILAACEDPIGSTEPWGIDDGITRTLVRTHVFAMLLVTETPDKTVRILDITYLP